MHHLFCEGADFESVFEVLAGDERDDMRWARSVVDSIHPLIQEHLGVAIQWFDHEDLVVKREVQVVGTGWSPRVRLTREQSSMMGAGAMAAIFRPRHPYVSVAATLRKQPDPGAREVFDSYGIGDIAGVLSSPTSNRIVTLAWISEREQPPTANELRQISRLSLHIDSGIRLRQTQHVEGIVGPDGETLEGSAGRVQLWRALRAGRVTLVPFGRGPTRHFRIVTNTPAMRARRALTSRELTVLELSSRGTSGKQQAFMLGLAQSSVSRLLASGATKLGTPSVLEAIHLVAGLTRSGALPAVERLTQAERTVLELVQRGHSNQQIADARQTSVRTVANQVASLLRKTGCDGRRGLVALPTL